MRQSIIIRIICILIFTASQDVFCQTANPKIDLLFISCWGDSLIPQGYELDIKSKKIYFVNPVMNYLDIKGGKRRYHMKYTAEKRTKIFGCFNEVNFSDLNQYTASEKDKKYFTVRLIFSNNNINEYKIPDKLLPEDLRRLYNAIIE
jgi:hypothetical protein